MNPTTCSLDPFNTKIIMQHSEQFINVFVYIINLRFSSGIFPASFKAAIVKTTTKETLSRQRNIKKISSRFKLNIFVKTN